MKNSYIIALVSLLLIISSCKTNTENNSSKETVITEEVETTTIDDSQIEISTPAGDKIGGFALNPLKINVGGNTYTSKTKPGKHKFYTNGTMVYEIKLKGEGFKLRDENSNLLWKIKVYPDKIKISDNEENQNAFEIKNKEGKIKIKKNEEELYRVQFNASFVVANDTAIYQLSSDQDYYGYAILAIKEIPEEQRMFILAGLIEQL
ncbi:hypothetical protein [Aquimarina sp. I32.4]|uniref:hypothetical protein n=1 Tax=Aquimarina sp. I32.4 TaxID=2053903 RepID=UPI000CDEF134|nr:hypothetical protein [Aquimarina sp. I32.4]